jgi:hypothetical protein
VNKLLFFFLFFVPVLVRAQNMQQIEQSLDNGLKSAKAAESRGDKKTLPGIYNNIGGIYLSVAKLPSEVRQSNADIPAEKKEILRKCIEYSNKAVDASEAVGDEENLKAAYQNRYSAEKMAGKLKDAIATAAKLTSLKHGIKSKHRRLPSNKNNWKLLTRT